MKRRVEKKRERERERGRERERWKQGGRERETQRERERETEKERKKEKNERRAEPTCESCVVVYDRECCQGSVVSRVGACGLRVASLQCRFREDFRA